MFALGDLGEMRKAVDAMADKLTRVEEAVKKVTPLKHTNRIRRNDGCTLI